MPRSSKRFIISNSGLNAQGFRMLTEGALLDDFAKNPIMLFNHQRPEGNLKNQILPIGYWDDVKIEGDDVTGVPVFDDNDEFAMAIYNKVEAGIIRMCSAGAEPLETSDDESLLLPDQEKATVTKWRLKEASICDIGANPGALAVALYSHNDKLINLSEINIETIIPKINMTQKKKVILSDDPNNQNNELADDNQEGQEEETVESLKAKLAEMEEKLKLAEEQLRLSDEKEEEQKVENLVNKAVASKKITLAQKPHYIKLAKADFKATEDLLLSIKSVLSVKEQLNGGAGENDKITKLSEKSWDDLHKSGEMSYVKLHAPDVYKTKFREKFGKEPKN